MKARIFFVDDERHLLMGLKRKFRRFRDQWDIHFFFDARDALEALRKEPARVIVSDMKMPEMNGAEFLAKAREICPQAFRVILSGELGEGLGNASLEVASQCLAKPTSPDRLQGLLADLLEVQDAVGEEEYVAALSCLQVLPVSSEDLHALGDLLEQGLWEGKELTELIERNPGLLAKLLQIANSSFFRKPTCPIFGAKHAVECLGIENLKNLLKTGLLAAPVPSEMASVYPRLQRFSRDAGKLAYLLAERNKFSVEDLQLAKTCGHLSHLGFLLCSSLSISSCLPRDSGRFLGNLWGLPEPLVENLGPQPKKRESFPEELPNLLSLARATLSQEGDGLPPFPEAENLSIPADVCLKEFSV